MALVGVKDRPRALGAEREWGCLRSPSCDACPYHEAVAHIKLLESWFPECIDDLGFPLFPGLDGSFFEEAARGALVEAIAARLGQPLVTKLGANRYGERSWRSTGAVYLTALGIELYAFS